MVFQSLFSYNFKLISKLLKSYSMDKFLFLDTPGTPGSNSPVEIFSFSCLLSAFLTNSATWWHFSSKFYAKFCGSSILYIYDPRHLECCQFELDNAIFWKNVHSHSKHLKLFYRKLNNVVRKICKFLDCDCNQPGSGFEEITSVTFATKTVQILE